MKRVWLFVVLVCASFGLFAGELPWVPVGKGGSAVEAPLVTTLTTSQEAIAFEVSVPGLQVAEVATKAGAFGDADSLIRICERLRASRTEGPAS